MISLATINVHRQEIAAGLTVLAFAVAILASVERVREPLPVNLQDTLELSASPLASPPTAPPFAPPFTQPVTQRVNQQSDQLAPALPPKAWLPPAASPPVTQSVPAPSPQSLPVPVAAPTAAAQPTPTTTPTNRPPAPVRAAESQMPTNQSPSVAPPAVASNTVASQESTYVNLIRAQLNAGKRYPTGREASLQRPSGKAVVWFVLTRSGQLQDAGILDSSDSILLDAAAVSTVRRASFPPWPEQSWPGQTSHRFNVTLDFAPTNS